VARSLNSSGKLVLLWALSLGTAFAVGIWVPTPIFKEANPPSSADETIDRDTGSKVSAPREGALGGIGSDYPEEGRLNTPDSPNRPSTLSTLLTGTASSLEWRRAMFEAESLDPQNARDWFNVLLQAPTSPQRDRLLGVLLGRLAQTAPVEALDLVGRIGSVSASESARNRILESWAERNPNAALVWIESNRGSTPNRMFRSRMESWMNGFAAVDPVGAFAHVIGLGESTQADRRLKGDLIEIAVETQIANGRLGEVIGLMEGIPEGPVRTEALQELYQEWAKQDPLSASRHFLENREEGSERIAAGLIREWASSDPEAAASFVEGLEVSDPAFSVAISSLIERWTRYDLERPAEWLNQLPPSEEIDRAVAVYSLRASEGDPAGAMTWAASIASEQTRARVMQRVAANWKETDPQGLETYIVENQLDEETATQLREARQGRRWWNRF